MGETANLGVCRTPTRPCRCISALTVALSSRPAYSQCSHQPPRRKVEPCKRRSRLPPLNRSDERRNASPGAPTSPTRPELKSYYAELAKLEAGALWTVANDIEPWFPKPKSVPVMWRYKDLRSLVQKATELVSAEDAGRRVVMLVNPGRKELPAACGLLFSGLQIMNAGEVASSHKHMASALRFIMEGEGAYTVVDGERVTLDRNDFVITPNGTWHEHGVDASGTQCIWQDGLDIPMVNALDANFFAVHKDMRQKEEKAADSSWGSFGAGFLLPADARAQLEEALFAAAEISVGADLRCPFARGQNLGRFALRRHPDGLREPSHGRSGHGDDRRGDAVVAAGRADQGAPAHRQFRLSVRQGQRPLDHRRPALRLVRARYLRRAVVGGRIATPTRRRARTPACSLSMICLSCARSV